MARTASLSGYLELLPAERLVELHLLDTLREVFEAHGYSNLETRAVETVDTLLQKGEIDKEIYAISRIHDDDAAKEAKLALRFDNTVPFARYVTENAGHLAFPYRRYQIQKVWRGERPQAGRFREFTQADIDIVGEGALSTRADVEIAVVMAKALQTLQIGEFTLRVNSRKLSEGFYQAIGLTETAAVLRAVDKLEKIGPDRVARELSETAGATEEQARQALSLAQIRTADTSFASQVRELLPADAAGAELLEEGLAELTEVVDELNARVPGRAEADLSIARGLDYYTGTVIETVLRGHEELGSICSGGRYESLATKGKRSFPGVGLSIGVTRLLSALVDSGELGASRTVPTAVYVTLRADEDWAAAQDVADQLRARGISAEVAFSAEKFGKQIKYADKRGIPFVWFTDGDGGHEVKDIRSGEQTAADPASWSPPAEDLTPQIIHKTAEG
ncbi:histidine--tRNA ligase [Nesterenkonia alkaliphila]|uniref:Histidine--tRNA ligase n=1 Tax=Nesterenkonia alkaliphila TaxID=1463631 RepID=A0A7K1UKY6_9MICC|nr:histidine--tRNA ligase [Nesterenkonia alkaliphila]MVT27094.1 histidine--tRNA ligase [Nesterenkonia alkaliphila]GFZ89038.1 histidine--tRNA ligase [Nesterenkonia alkaliphila]